MIEKYLVITFLFWLTFLVFAKIWNTIVDDVGIEKETDRYKALQVVGWFIYFGIGLFSATLICLLIYSKFI